MNQYDNCLTSVMSWSRVCAVLAALAAPGIGHAGTTLRVALYPYVPQGDSLFYQLEAAFEASHPNVNVELVTHYTDANGESQSLGWYYYSGPDEDPVPGILRTDADVIEVDSVLLSEMVEARRLQPVTLPSHADWIPGAVAATALDGVQWTVPHWVCGNFLFYEAGDDAIAGAKDWAGLVDAADAGIMMDMKGTSTLGEWYLTALDKSGDDALAALGQDGLDPAVTQYLESLLSACPAGLCRSDTLHDTVGIYGRLFMRGSGDAYIGYSESLNATIAEATQSCIPQSGCREESEIAVRALPPPDGEGPSVGWVDGLGVAAGLSGRKRALANEFIAFAVTWAAYESVLNPPWGTPPRYLLPARSGWDRLSPSMYPLLESAFGDRQFYSDGNSLLREKGRAVDGVLPSDRKD